MRGVEIYNVANYLDLADPSAFRGPPMLFFDRLQGRHWAATLGHCNCVALIIDLIEESKALGL